MKIILLAISVCLLSGCAYIPEICWAIEEIDEVVQHPKPPIHGENDAAGKG